MSTESHLWCWWCCHTFDTQAMSLPISYDEKKQAFAGFGTFCSFSCMKAYNHYENLSQKGNQYMLISLLYSKSNPQKAYQHVVCAPPRQCLKEFGGDMDISTFREQNDTVYELQLPPMINVSHIIDRQQTNSNWVMKSGANPNTGATFNINDTKKVSNNAIKIKPNKKQVNTLDGVLGIFQNR